MNKSQVILKKIQADKLFTISWDSKSQSKLTKKLTDFRCKSAVAANRKAIIITSHTQPISTIKIKQKNMQLSKKTYSNLKIFTSLNKNTKRLKSCQSTRNENRMVAIEQSNRKSQEIFKHKLADKDGQAHFIYKPFPRRESFIKNNNAAKFFYQPSQNQNFIKFLSMEVQTEVRLSEKSVYQRKKWFQNPEVGLERHNMNANANKIAVKNASFNTNMNTNPQSYSSFSSSNSKPFTADSKTRRVIYNDSGQGHSHSHRIPKPKTEELEPWGVEAEDNQFN